MTALDTAGSTLFKLTWKRRRTPLGRSYLERAVSVGQTSGSGFTSWPTPTANPANGEPEAFLERKRKAMRNGSQSMGVCLSDINMVAKLASWATPRTEDAESSGMRVSRGVADTLTAQSSLAGWSTPTCPAPHDSEQTVGKARPRDGYGQDIAIQASLAGWPTPMAGNPGTERYNEAGNTDSSRKTVDLAGWPTPTTEDAKRDDWTDRALIEATAAGIAPPQSSQRLRSFAQLAGPARLKASGEIVTGFTADPNEGIPMDAGGQLRAGHSRWLMAIPAAWDGFASTAMQSISKLRRRGSKRTSKA